MTDEPEKALEYWKQAEKLAAEPVENESEKRDEKEWALLKKKIANKKYYTK
jgi:hypothetical protein